jgi:hypothetical protein
VCDGRHCFGNGQFIAVAVAIIFVVIVMTIEFLFWDLDRSKISICSRGGDISAIVVVFILTWIPLDGATEV